MKFWSDSFLSLKLYSGSWPLENSEPSLWIERGTLIAWHDLLQKIQNVCVVVVECGNSLVFCAQIMCENKQSVLEILKVAVAASLEFPTEVRFHVLAVISQFGLQGLGFRV